MLIRRRTFRRILLHRSEEHTSELQSRVDLVCRLLLEKKKKQSSPWSARSVTEQWNKQLPRARGQRSKQIDIVRRQSTELLLRPWRCHAHHITTEGLR